MIQLNHSQEIREFYKKFNATARHRVTSRNALRKNGCILIDERERERDERWYQCYDDHLNDVETEHQTSRRPK